MKKLRSHPSPDNTITRRNLVRGGAAFAATGLMGKSMSKTTSAQENEGSITIPEARTDLPTDDVTFRWVDSGDVKTFFWQEFFASYQEAHPNITMEYQGLPWTEIRQVVPLGVRNGNAPDVFHIPDNVPAAQAAAEGWGIPLDDIIPDFEDFKSGFPEGTFVPGLTDFDGKTYTMPLTTTRRHGSLLLYNRQYLEEAGYDPESTPLTVDEFREVTRKLTEQGGGDYYGLILEGAQVGRLANFVNVFARTAGKNFGVIQAEAPFDWTTGEFCFTSDEHLAAIELLIALRDDDVIFPGSTALNAPEARARVPQGDAAMIIQGPWNVSQWKRESPDFSFGVALPPATSTDAPGMFPVAPGGENYMWVYSQSQLTSVAADILMYMGTLEGQRAWAQIVGIADAPLFPEANDAMGDDAETAQTISIFDETVRLGPDARVRNPEAATVYQNIVPVQPDYGTIVQGVFTGQIGDPQQAMQQLQDAWTAELDRAIEAANSGGAGVSRDDFVFSNWDPTQDYTPEMYDAL